MFLHQPQNAAAVSASKFASMICTAFSFGHDANEDQKSGGLSLEYAPEPVPDSIVVQRMQEFALARREHEQFYSIDWKYLAQERTLANWPETCVDMQTRLDPALAHISHIYGRVLQNSDREVDLSIIFVTHASPVNGMPADTGAGTSPNCSISRYCWTPLKAGNEEATQGLRDVLMRSKVSQTVNQEHGH
ncbi:hypothetical protein BG005_000725 [Podila minutissima]|nr:hypothetical protein BG005_000725 [Podila minutissima]